MTDVNGDLTSTLILHTESAARPIKLTFDGFGDLCPRDDITPPECAWLAILLTAAAVPSPAGRLDFCGFISAHGLARHFTDAPESEGGVP